MAFQHKPNRGSLWKNDRAKEGSNDPQYAGTINVDGKEYWLNGWLQDSTKGKYFSLSVKLKGEAQAAPAEAEPAKPDVEDDVPFSWRGATLTHI